MQISRYRPTEQGILFDLGQHKDIALGLLGRHNALNGAAVFSLALCLQIEEKCIRKAFAAFQGTKRRLEFKGESEGVQVFDDYGHHPTEIAVTLRALRDRVGKRRLIVVFEPYRFSRTQEQLEAFADCFPDADASRSVRRVETTNSLGWRCLRHGDSDRCQPQPC